MAGRSLRHANANPIGVQCVVHACCLQSNAVAVPNSRLQAGSRRIQTALVGFRTSAVKIWHRTSTSPPSPFLWHRRAFPHPRICGLWSAITVRHSGFQVECSNGQGVLNPHRQR